MEGLEWAFGGKRWIERAGWRIVERENLFVKG
jgi:hypothetical protein